MGVHVPSCSIQDDVVVLYGHSDRAALCRRLREAVTWQEGGIEYFDWEAAVVRVVFWPSRDEGTCVPYSVVGSLSVESGFRGDSSKVIYLGGMRLGQGLLSFVKAGTECGSSAPPNSSTLSSSGSFNCVTTKSMRTVS